MDLGIFGSFTRDAAFFAAGVIVAGKLWIKWKIAQGEKQAHIHNA